MKITSIVVNYLFSGLFYFMCVLIDNFFRNIILMHVLNEKTEKKILNVIYHKVKRTRKSNYSYVSLGAILKKNNLKTDMAWETRETKGTKIKATDTRNQLTLLSELKNSKIRGLFQGLRPTVTDRKHPSSFYFFPIKQIANCVENKCFNRKSP